MFTEAEKNMLLVMLAGSRTAVERVKSKAREPEFGPIYEKRLQALAALAMKIQAMEVKK